jgi:hypothetical protein
VGRKSLRFQYFSFPCLIKVSPHLHGAASSQFFLSYRPTSYLPTSETIFTEEARKVFNKFKNVRQLIQKLILDCFVQILKFALHTLVNSASTVDRTAFLRVCFSSVSAAAAAVRYFRDCIATNRLWAARLRGRSGFHGKER